MQKNSKIWIICGGISEERDISLRSGKNFYEACLRLGYINIKLFNWENQTSLIEIIEANKNNKIDKAILLTHGNYGEDGKLQGFLDILKIPYTGSKQLSSAICMNKTRTKEILSYYKLPVLKTYEAADLLNEDLIEGEFILKPKSGGSSVGITKFNNHNEFKDFCSINSALVKSIDKYFAEEFIHGIELTTSIIENLSKEIDNENIYKEGNLTSLPILELRPKNEFYDYEAKYTKGMTEFIVPAEIDSKLEKEVHKIAIKAFKALDCRSFTRVDFIIDKKNMKPYILELNTLPGMTDTSDMPAQAEAAGISYDELVQAIIESV